MEEEWNGSNGMEWMDGIVDGIEWNGMEWMEWNGMNRMESMNGIEWNGMESNGMDVEWNGMIE